MKKTTAWSIGALIIGMLLGLILAEVCLGEENTELYLDNQEVAYVSLPPSPDYICSIHGGVPGEVVMTFAFDGECEDLNGDYCFYCIAEFMRNNFWQLEEVEE